MQNMKYASQWWVVGVHDETSRVLAAAKMLNLPARLTDLTILGLRERHAFGRSEQIGESVGVLPRFVVLTDVLERLFRGHVERLQPVGT